MGIINLDLHTPGGMMAVVDMTGWVGWSAVRQPILSNGNRIQWDGTRNTIGIPQQKHGIRSGLKLIIVI